MKLLATYVPMNNHMVFAAVEADDMDTVREFAFQSRLGQWNTIEIYQTSTLEEALDEGQRAADDLLGQPPASGPVDRARPYALESAPP